MSLNAINNCFLAQPEPQQSFVTAGSSITQTLHPGKILIVDDSQDNRDLVVQYLVRLGFKTETASSGPEALAKVAASTYQVMLLDLQMPNMDGFEALRELRMRDYQGPVIAFTAHAMKGDRERCLDAGFDDYLSKPINKTTLKKVLGRFFPIAPSF